VIPGSSTIAIDQTMTFPVDRAFDKFIYIYYKRYIGIRKKLLGRIMAIKAGREDSILEAGYLRVGGPIDEEGSRYTMRFLTEEDLQSVVRLQEIVLYDLKDPELYHPSTQEDFLRYLRNGYSIGVAVDGGLIGYGIIYLPEDENENLGLDIGMPDEDLQYVVHFQSSVIHPDYRGNSFQTKIIGNLFDIIHDIGRYHLLCTISPKNYYSLSNTLRSGFVIKEIKEKFGGLLRCILYKDLRPGEGQTWQDITIIRSSDIEGQRKLLGDGYVGFDVSRGRNEFFIHYGKSKAEG